MSKRKQKSDTCKKINYKNVKEAVDKELISDLNNQTYFRYKDGTYPSLLYVALKSNDTALIEFLIDQKVDLNVVEEGRMPFIFDIMTKYREEYFEYEYLGAPYKCEVIRRAIKAGLDVNASTWKGYSPLSRSLIDSDVKMAELLIKSGANVNPPLCKRKNCPGCSPLSRAIELKYNTVIDLLLIKGCNLNSTSCNNSNLPLTMTLYPYDIEITIRLINSGADVNAIDGIRGSFLHVAMKNYRLEVVEFLLKNTFVDVNIQDLELKRTALHCINFCNEKCLDSLLNANPDINIVNKMNELVVERKEVFSLERPEIAVREKEITKKIKIHLVKLRAAGFYLIDRNIAAISGEEYEKFYAKCCQEVDSMKKTKISPASHINFYDVLFMTYEKLALCLESLDDQEIMQSNFKEKFPLYAGMIEFKFTRANLWIKLREKVNAEVYRLFNDNLPSIIMEKILSFFSIPELMKL